MSGCAWVTLATNDTYCLGALVLGHSLKRVCTRHQLAIIITPTVSSSMREQLLKVFDVVHLVDILDSQDAASLALLQRPDLGVTFTKIHCWTLTQFSKCVFLDADTLVMQNCDELMEREELSAAPDPGWPDCFNSGVFVFVPNADTFKQLVNFATIHGSFDGGDQGLLNMYFNDWPTGDIRKHLSFLYNMCSTSTYTYLPALKYYGANIKIVHFIGANKPWLLGPSGAGMSSFTQAWWDTFQSSVVQNLNKDMTGLAGAFGSKEKSIIEEQWRKQNWEQGNIDFTGKDSFENIWQKIMDAVNKPQTEEGKSTILPVSKEIVSQAIPEKEKADIPSCTEVPKPEKSDEPKKTEEIKEITSVANISTELPKEEPIQPVPVLPTAEASVLQPIPMPPPTPDNQQAPPKLPELPLATTPESILPTIPPSSELLKEGTLPVSALPDQPKLGENILSEPSKEAAPIQPGQPQEAESKEKIVDILKLLEQQLEEQIRDEKKENLPSLEPSKETSKADELVIDPKKLEESQCEPAKIAPNDNQNQETSKIEPPKEAGPKPDAPAPEAKTDASNVVEPMVPLKEPLKTELPQSDIPKSEAPKTEGPLPEAPKVECLADPSLEAVKAKVSMPEIAKAETPKPDIKTESVPTQDIPKTAEPQLEAPKAEVEKSLPVDPASRAKSESSSVSVPETVKDPKQQEATTPIDVADNKKQKTPPKDQKSAKQQAPQPPSKNGNQKKGLPSPTSTHPLAETPVQSESLPAKDGQQDTRQPVTPPLSPVTSTEKTSESQIFPSPPTVTGPTPPVSPIDASKTEDPLSPQAKKDTAQPTGTSSSTPVDAPVPPKRKGKGNGQSQKPQQSNGGKGKGKK